MLGELKIDILIPTFNRSNFLKKNLDHIAIQINTSKNSNTFNIIISDNASSDDTEKIIGIFIMENPGIHIKYNRNEINTGLEKNMVKLLSLANNEFVLWIGDDDYLADGYLKFLVEKINIIDDLGLVIPGLQSLNKNGKYLIGRKESFKHINLSPGYENTLNYSHLAHQMSGLLMKRESLLKDYLLTPEYRNPYLFIYFAANRMLKYNSIYAPEFKTTIVTYNEKDWRYNQVGLLDEVYKSYLALKDNLTEKHITELLLHFTMMHSYRLNINIWNPFRLFNQYSYLTHSLPKLKGINTRLALLLLKEYLSLTFKES
jgi:glycosyltransferase involved in cell wall biosynthesis